jgi:two-component system chemotaxis sensor kinase CheA
VSSLLSKLLLPKEISAFERSYLARMNRIGLWFFGAHVPVLTAIALVNGTGVFFALVSSLAVLAGPLLASRVLASPRSVSTSFGVASMLMGGVLVHVGQGPIQIEMHFYFFVLIALLAVFANPAVVLTAAVTVAGHHLLGWLLLPKSVFNYEAPVWVVLVHAGFVVLESVAACFIARSFFDNVIGLEKIVAARTSELDGRNHDMRLVLDNVQQGFLTIDKATKVSPEYSAVVETWYGKPAPDEHFGAMLTRISPSLGLAFEVGWDEVTSGLLPLEVTLDQLPHRFQHAGKTFDLTYQPIVDAAGELVKALVVTTDVTASVERARLERQQRETITVIDRIAKDKQGFLEFVDDADRLLARLVSGLSALEAKRALHTLKGNAAIFGMHTVADACHDLETATAEGHAPDTSELESVAAAWAQVKASLRLVLGSDTSRGVEIADAEYSSILRAALDLTPHKELARRIADWRLEPTAKRLDRVAAQAKGVAERLGKEVTVVTEDGGLKLEPETWAPFWSSFVHVVRNAADHGIEPNDVRRALGKGPGKLTISTRVSGARFLVTVEDDGGGIAWDTLRAKAASHGLPHETRADLVEALFADGVSTAQTVTDVSGRGVGMGAVREMCQRLGGTVEVDSTPGRGTKITLSFPARSMTRDPEEVLAAA